MPVESSSVQEYLDQMHEYTTIAAIQVTALDKFACSIPVNGNSCQMISEQAMLLFGCCPFITQDASKTSV